MKIKRKISKLIKNQRGSTMVEVLMAFVLLMIGVAGYTKIIQFSDKMFMSATDNIKAQEDMSSYIAKKTKVGQKLTGQNITLCLDSEKTNGNNRAKMVTISLDSMTVEKFQCPDSDILLYRFARK